MKKVRVRRARGKRALAPVIPFPQQQYRGETPEETIRLIESNPTYVECCRRLKELDEVRKAQSDAPLAKVISLREYVRERARRMREEARSARGVER